MDGEQLRREILEKTRQFASLRKKEAFVPGKSKVHYAGRVYDHEEVVALVDSALDFWLTSGRFAAQFEREFAGFFGTQFCVLANSGSSANLLALSALTSDSLGERKLSPGDKVITCSTGFPTTVNPIFQNGLVPIFVDADIGTYNPNLEAMKEAAERGARAIMTAHTLGNPFDLDSVSALAKKHGIYLVEDCCDAAGATFDGRPVGTFGDIATMSFYPAHHMTMGEGGAVMTSSPLLKKLVESFRDWGRDCWCAPGKSNTCGRRFGWKLGDLPPGYDHKYIYSNVGYNLKVTDMQAACGLPQIKKLPAFIKKRRENFGFYAGELQDYGDYFVLPEQHPKAVRSPFGFPLTVREGAPFTRDELVSFLEGRNIETRMLFCGNMVRQPAYKNRKYEKVGELANSDTIMKSTFWIGVYPGLTEEMLRFVADSFHEFIKSKG